MGWQAGWRGFVDHSDGIEQAKYAKMFFKTSAIAEQP